MAAIKPLTTAQEKWVRRATVASPDYQSGVQTPKRPWDQAAIEANASYTQAVTKAASEGRYAKGIQRVGLEKWKKMASTKGPSRYAEGVQISKDQWALGFDPYHKAIEAVKLPDRGPKGDPKNIQRVATIATTLRQLKEKLG